MEDSKTLANANIKTLHTNTTNKKTHKNTHSTIPNTRRGKKDSENSSSEKNSTFLLEKNISVNKVRNSKFHTQIEGDLGVRGMFL